MVLILATKDDPMTKLSDTQAIILSAAGQRPGGNLLPLPGSLRGGAAVKVVGALLARGLAREEVIDRTTRADTALNTVWRNEDDGRAVLPTVAALMVWSGLLVALLLLIPIGSFFLVFGKAWARWLVGTLSVLVLVAQPLLCYAVLGWDGLLRDGLPLIVTAVLGLVALRRSRGLPTWVRTTT